METGIKQIEDGHPPSLAGIFLRRTVWAILAKFTSTFGNLGSEHQAGMVKGTCGGFEPGPLCCGTPTPAAVEIAPGHPRPLQLFLWRTGTTSNKPETSVGTGGGYAARELGKGSCNRELHCKVSYVNKYT